MHNVTFDNLDINLTVHDGIISHGKLNSKQVQHSLTMSPFEVRIISKEIHFHFSNAATRNK